MSIFTASISDLDAEASALCEGDRKAAQEERLVPLVDRLRRLLATFPAEQLQAGVSLEAIREQLRGRQRGYAHAGELGDALRKLGFVRIRLWTKRDGFSAVWRRAS
jgi:hypothetical protein